MQRLYVGATANSYQDSLCRILPLRRHYGDGLFSWDKALRLSLEDDLDTSVGEHRQHCLGDVTIFTSEEGIPLLEDRHLSPEGRIHTGELQRDIATTYDDQPCWERVKLQKPRTIIDTLVVSSLKSQGRWARSGIDIDALGLDLTSTVLRQDFDYIRREEARRTRQDLYARDRSQLIIVGSSEGGGQLLTALHRSLEGSRLIGKTCALLALDQQELGGDTANVDTSTAIHRSALLYEDHGLTVLRQVSCQGLASLPEADDQMRDGSCCHLLMSL